MDINNYVGAKIKDFRESRDWTQDQLAKKLNTSRQTISRYESNTRKISPDTLFELSLIFDTTIDSFFPTRTKVIIPNQLNENKANLLAAHLNKEFTDDDMAKILDYIDMIKRSKK
ncbi:helix-turn-helix domain-containing protein [Latilactobacillus fragifolii]|uniref:helix-turn-helix domain-containing protein n=1 Tax=Latilactobacillus fragifolii TaxID=2814244 RepID=UPI001ABB4FF1|nr:helix-turn-helix transcriptional regulator [Latilactobacillus fragifolii]